jgi:hypothetical protein
MLAAFCLRLACGLMAALLLLSPREVNPRFYRTHFLVALGLCVVALAFAWQTAWPWLALAAGGAAVLAVLASLSWSLEEAPGGRLLNVLTLALLLAAVVPAETALAVEDRPATGWLIANGLTSAALLGAATTAMLIGHSYLIAPAMSMRPLLTLLAAGAVALAARAIVAGAALVSWTAGRHSFTLEEEAVLVLPVRWGLGLAGPLVLGVMAWRCARIRSTQSATGILYVVVIFCFLGELTSLLLLSNTRLPL